MKTTPPARRVNLTALAFVAAMAATAGMARADAGAPLPLCSENGLPFYAVSYFGPATAGAAPTVTLSQVTIAGATTTSAQTWTAQSATSPNYPNPDAVASGASVAAGMGKDGYIYALRAVDGDLWTGATPNAWRADFRRYQLLRYGTAGVSNLGIVTGLGTYWTNPNDSTTAITGAVDARFDNFNAADVNPRDGLLYVAMFRTGGALNQIHKIDVNTTPPSYKGTLTLTSNIPGLSSGDFAIDASGQFAYGIAVSGTTVASYKINLASGAVETLNANAGFTFATGGAARLADGSIALYGPSVVQILNTTTGNLGPMMAGPPSVSSDAAACLAALPPAATPVPALEWWGLTGLASLLAGLGLWRQRRRG